MALRYARTDALGLVVAPPKLDCMGADCPVAERRGYCYTDEHHLYFSPEVFARHALTQAFRANRFNKIRIPRCRHDQYHNQIDRVHVPELEVVEAFLDEAAVLAQLGVVTETVLRIERQLTSDDVQDVSRVACSPGGPRGFEERLEEHRQKQTECLEQASRLEVVPQRLIFASNVIGAQAIWAAKAA